MAYDPSTARPETPGTNGDSARAGFDEETFDAQRAETLGARNGRGRSPGELLRQLLGEVTVLFRKELALAASEVSRSVNEAKHGAMGMATGGAVLYAGILFLLGAVTLWLATMMQTWAAALIVGAVVTIVGFIMVQAGKKQMSASDFTPDRTVESLRKDKAAVQRQMP
jgi:Putative Actinobacterial Holin-X, holin superfamily III